MCGVFGAIAANGSQLDAGILRELAASAQTRGRHAHGLAWVDSRGRLRRWRDQGPITANEEWLDMIAGARAVIGHCRYATQGAWSHNENNHPHPADGGWMVHNGIVRNYARLVSQHGLYPSSECDSEALGLLIETLPGSLLERCRRAVSLATGPHVVLGLWTRPLRLAVVRAGNPLHVGRADGVAYYGSLPAGLPGKPKAIRERTARLIVPRGADCEQTIEELPELATTNGRLAFNFEAAHAEA